LLKTTLRLSFRLRQSTEFGLAWIRRTNELWIQFLIVVDGSAKSWNGSSTQQSTERPDSALEGSLLGWWQPICQHWRVSGRT